MTQDNHTRSQYSRKSSNIHTRFNLNAATSFGGAMGLVDFVLGTGIDREFWVKGLRKRKNAQFHADDIALTLVLGSLLGQEGIFHFEDIEQDPLLSLKLDLPKLPDMTLLYKDLKRLGSSAGIQAIRSAQRRILKALLPKGRDIVVDVDSSIETVYGQQQRSVVDIIHIITEEPVSTPCWRLIPQTGCCIYDELRSGDAHTANGFTEFYEAMKKQLSVGVHIRAVRMDKKALPVKGYFRRSNKTRQTMSLSSSGQSDSQSSHRDQTSPGIVSPKVTMNTVMSLLSSIRRHPGINLVGSFLYGA